VTAFIALEPSQFLDKERVTALIVQLNQIWNKANGEAAVFAAQ